MFEELMESYGIFEEDGELFIENEMIEYVMDEFDLYAEDAIEVIMESFEEELLESKGTTVKEKEQISRYYAGMNPKNGTDHSVRNRRLAKGGAAVGGAALVAGGALLARKAMKKKGKKRKLREDYGIFEENGELFIESEMVEYVMDEFDLYEEDAINVIMEAYEEELFSEEEEKQGWKEKAGKYVGDPRNLRTSAPEFGGDLKNYADSLRGGNEQDRRIAKDNLKASGKQFAKDAAIPAGAAVVAGGAVLATKAAKAHKAKKAAAARRKRGILGRLREDYGIFEEDGELFIDQEMVELVMESYDLDEEDAIDVIMESYEEELLFSEAGTSVKEKEQISRYYAGMNPKNGTDHSVRNRRLAKGGAAVGGAALVAGGAILARKAMKKKGKKGGKKHLREDALSVAHSVSSDSHYHVSDDAHRLYRQAEMDEGDADRNLARGGKNILGGIRQAPRSEQDKAGREGVRFKNRVDDGDMDGEFVDSGIQKPMGAGRRIAEDSDMGF